MTECRITKYNPANRVDGKYIADEWTSFSDIGKKFNGTELSYERYRETEKAYIDCCIELIQKAHIPSLSVSQVENYADGIYLPTSVSNTEEICQAIAYCLREQCWFKLTGKDLFIHFGYDYYMYIGSTLTTETIKNTAIKHGLYCEEYPSPYNMCV